MYTNNNKIILFILYLLKKFETNVLLATGFTYPLKIDCLLYKIIFLRKGLLRFYFCMYTYSILDFSDGNNGRIDYNDWANMEFDFFKNSHFKWPKS